MTIRLLTKEDQGKFQIALNDYLVEEQKRTNRTYDLGVTTNFLKNNLGYFERWPLDDYVVSAGFDEDGGINSMAIGIKCYLFWQAEKDRFPAWILNMVYLKNKLWQSPKDRIHELLIPLTGHMERCKYYTFYKVNKVPKNINNDNADAWLREKYAMSVSRKRYYPFIERFLRCKEDVDALPSTFRSMVSPFITFEKNYVLMSHHLRQGLRNL